LIYEYEEAPRIARIKFEKSVMQVIVSTAAEILEDLVKIKWEKLAEIPFEIRKERVGLLEAEQSATGREVAYILTAREHFR
jgi:hypothetical protein